MRSFGYSWPTFYRKHLFTVDIGSPDLRFEDRGFGNFIEIAIYQDEVGIVAGDQLAFVRLRKFGVGRTLRVGIKRLPARELVGRKVLFRAGLVLPRDRGV